MVSKNREIKFKRLDVTVMSFDPPKVLVKWILFPTVLPLQDYTFKIERSENSSDSFEHISTIPGNSVDFIDYTPEFHHTQRKYYYKLTATNNKTKNTIIAPIGTWDGEPTFVSAEMARLLTDLLEDRTGEPTFYFQQMTEGAKCPSCWDHATSRSTNPDCPTCKGTGRYGGYYEPILTMVDYYPDSKVIEYANWGETQPNQLDILLSNYPVLQNRGVLVKAQSNKSYRIDNVRIIEEPGSDVIIHQIARVSEINRSDIDSKLEIPSGLRLQAINKLRDRKELREF